MNKPFVAIMMGSDSDLPIVINTIDVLRVLAIDFEIRVCSSHRTPAQTYAYVEDADQRGAGVFICASGMAAHLAGVVAAHTIKPVIGVPINSSLEGMDALLSTVQMPSGIPVATVAIGKTGAKNAAFLAAQMLALSDSELANRLREERIAESEAVMAKDAALQEKLKKNEI